MGFLFFYWISMFTFSKEYQSIYPNDLHLKHELWYYTIKKHISSSVINHIIASKKKQIKICDIGGGYGYDDILIRSLLKEINPYIVVNIDVIDPTLDFYNTVHALSKSDIEKQNQITYIEESFLTIDTKKLHEHYDIIICSEVIEHLRTSEQEVFFSNFNRILKPAGLVALTCPNGSSIFKQLFWLFTRARKTNHIFEAEFNYRYSHIGVPTIFQVLWLFQRKWFQVNKIYASAMLSSTHINRLTMGLNRIFQLFMYLNLFFSTTNVHIATKIHKLDQDKRHNDSKMALDTSISLDTTTLTPHKQI